jgi:hypothetical protein
MVIPSEILYVSDSKATHPATSPRTYIHEIFANVLGGIARLWLKACRKLTP